MKLPVNIHLNFDGDEEEIFCDWMEKNQETVMDTLLASCWEFANNQELEEILVMNFIDTNELSHGEYVYQLSVTPDDVVKNLDECQNFFVETEQYEKALSVKNCREKIDNTKS